MDVVELFVLVIAILSFDLGILHKQNKEIGVRESVKLSALYIEKFPAALSRGVTFAIIAAGVVWSLMKTRDQQQPA